MPELMAHPWMTEGNAALKPHPFPNKLGANDINEDIVEHMVHVLKVSLKITCLQEHDHMFVQLKEREEEVTAELLADRACAISTIYFLLLARLDRSDTTQIRILDCWVILCCSFSDTTNKNLKSSYERSRDIGHMVVLKQP